MSKINKDEYVSATELSRLAYCPATIKQRIKPSGRNARSRSQYYGDLIHAETEQVILSHHANARGRRGSGSR